MNICADQQADPGDDWPPHIVFLCSVAVCGSIIFPCTFKKGLLCSDDKDIKKKKSIFKAFNEGW